MPKIVPYITDHPHSRVIIGAAAEGLRVEPHIASTSSWKAQPALVYGILRGCQDIIRKCRAVNIDWWHIDLGYFGRNHYDGYYRLSRNGFQASANVEPPGVRFGPPIAPWKSGNGPIVICPPTVLFSHNHPYEKLEENDWIDSVRRALAVLTDRTIVVRDKKNDTPLPEDPWCIIVHSSNIAIDALIDGTPAIALGESLVKELGPQLSNIEDYNALRAVHRAHLLSIAAHTQFTINEFRDGYAFWLSQEIQ